MPCLTHSFRGHESQGYVNESIKALLQAHNQSRSKHAVHPHASVELAARWQRSGAGHSIHHASADRSAIVSKCNNLGCLHMLRRARRTAVRARHTPSPPSVFLASCSLTPVHFLLAINAGARGRCAPAAFGASSPGLFSRRRRRPAHGCPGHRSIKGRDAGRAHLPTSCNRLGAQAAWAGPYTGGRCERVKPAWRLGMQRACPPAEAFRASPFHFMQQLIHDITAPLHIYSGVAEGHAAPCPQLHPPCRLNASLPAT